MYVTVMSESDIEEVKLIEEECQISFWSYIDYLNELKRKDALPLVLKIDCNLVGFLVARLITTKVDLSLSLFYDFNHKLLLKTILDSQEVNKKIEVEIEIYNIAVKPEFQNHGAGQKLINYLYAHTEKYRKRTFWLEVRKSNKKAIGFYKKNGFLKSYERKNFYTNPLENAIVMRKNLISF